ncbi:MAG TPA: SpoIIE family protein phosphatase [Stellaceae bacterium]|nr:SpoIIE family protein phosphatase [Stellaceae bacterium]
MPLRYRITVLIVVLLAVSVLGNTTLLMLLGEQAAVQRARADGVAIARLLANGIAIAERLPDVVDAQITRQMIAEAALAAQLIDVAHSEGLTDVAIESRLAQVVARTPIGRIVALDRDGRTTLRAAKAYEFPAAQQYERPLAEAFAGTAPGRHWAQALPPLSLPGHSAAIRFAGVRAPQGDGLVIVGQNTAAMQALRREIGPERNISAMVGTAGIEGIWIFGERRHLLARSVTRGDKAVAPTPRERASVAEVIRTAHAQSVNDGDLIRVTAPVLDDDGLPVGAAVIRFSTADLHAALAHTVFLSIALTLLLLIVAVAAANQLGRRISRPIVAIADAARSVRGRTYDDAMLRGIAQRNDEIGSLARDFGDMAHQVLAREEELDRLVSLRTQELNERNRQLTQAIDTIQTDLDAARALQHAILPQQFPSGRSISGVAVMTAARHVGGDFYDYFMVDDDHLAILIADVSGKGVPAGLFMAVSRTILRAQAMATPQPAECMRRANAQISAQNPMFLFITVFYGLLDIRTGRLRYVAAGHPPPILLRRAAHRLAPLPGTEGMALGIVGDLGYREGEVVLSVGDTLVLYTDGVSEAMDAAGDLFTDERILAALADEFESEVDAILEHLVDSVDRFVDGAPQSDDLTCIVLRYLGERAEAAAA